MLLTRKATIVFLRIHEIGVLCTYNDSVATLRWQLLATCSRHVRIFDAYMDIYMDICACRL